MQTMEIMKETTPYSTTARVACVLSPLEAILDDFPREPQKASHIAKAAAEVAVLRVSRELGYIPFSPVLSFAGVYRRDLEPAAMQKYITATLRMLRLGGFDVLVICKSRYEDRCIETIRKIAQDELFMRVEEVE